MTIAHLEGCSSDGDRSIESGDVPLERYQNYLTLLAKLHFDERLRRKMAPSDIVQQTLVKAYKARDQLQGKGSAQVAGWLRRILVHTMCDAARDLHREKRNVALERSMESAVGRSSTRLGDLLAADTPLPSADLERRDRLLRLSDALAQLPDAQRNALLMKHCEGMTVAAIGQRLGRSSDAVSSLIRRGLAGLREQLREFEAG